MKAVGYLHPIMVDDGNLCYTVIFGVASGGLDIYYGVHGSKVVMCWSVKKSGNTQFVPVHCRYSKSNCNFAPVNLLVRFLLSGVAVMLTAYLLPGVHVADYWAALLVAALISFSNMIIRPILILFTIPITVLTLGLFLLVINAGIILGVDYFVDDFHVDGFWWALAFSLILSIFNSLFTDLTKEKK
jgi:putative membrane protein